MNSIERILQTKNLLWYNFLLWLGLCVFEILKTYSFSENFDLNFEWIYLIRWPVSVYLTFWILSFLVFRGFIATRAMSKKIFFITHSLSSIAIGILFQILYPLIGLLLERLFLETETKSINELWIMNVEILFDLLFGIAVYWGMIIVLLGINYYRKFQDQYARSIDLEKQLGITQLTSMKMQMQPHFLFNAFNTIAMMIRQKKNDEAVVMVSNLSDMLRQSLSKETDQFVKLGEEISLLEKYLAIESQRYKERLVVEWDLDKELNDFKVPSLVLQPVVENAFKHGISKNIEVSNLRIATRKVNGYIELEVYNSGKGLPENWSFEKSKGIGLRNTANRLLKLYREEFKFLINTKEDGVSVIILLPLKNGKKD